RRSQAGALGPHLVVVLAGDEHRLLAGELLGPLPLQKDAERRLADAQLDELLRLELAADALLLDERAHVVADAAEAGPRLGQELRRGVRYGGGRRRRGGAGRR